MNEIYWITRLDDISFFLGSISVTCAILSGIAIFFICVTLDEGDIVASKNCIKFMKFSIPAFLLSMAINVFVPTTNEAMLIYGVGTTIDYVKQNNTLQQIPDKCINALDAWVDSFN